MALLQESLSVAHMTGALAPRDLEEEVVDTTVQPRAIAALAIGGARAAPLSAKLLKNGTLKTYKGFPHGMPTTEADTINADLLAFIRG